MLMVTNGIHPEATRVNVWDAPARRLPMISGGVLEPEMFQI
jgi:hypothetical protein